MKKSGRPGDVTVRGLSVYTFPLNLMASKSADAQEFLITYIYRICERAHIVRLHMSYISRAMNNGCGQAILQNLENCEFHPVISRVVFRELTLYFTAYFTA